MIIGGATGYDVAQICLNGHKINASARRMPQLCKSHCDRCGEKTIVQCPACNTPIRGFLVGLVSSSYDVPLYCPQCGKPYPWTESKKAAALELFLLESGADDKEAAEFEKDLDDIVRDTARAPVAASRFRRAMTKLGAPIANGIRDIVVELVSESVKKIIWPTK
jgi:hypothetical protein